MDDSYFDLLTQLGPSGAQCSLFPLKRILLNCDVVYKFVIFHQTGFFPERERSSFRSERQRRGLRPDVLGAAAPTAAAVAGTRSRT